MTTSQTQTLITTLQNVRDRAAKMEAEAHREKIEAELAIKLARGTRPDLGKQAAAAAKHAAKRSPYYIGDETPTPVLRDAVLRAITDNCENGLTLRELVELTGAGRNRISGVLVKLQVAGYKVANLGTPQVARWSCRPRARRPASR